MVLLPSRRGIARGNGRPHRIRTRVSSEMAGCLMTFRRGCERRVSLHANTRQRLAVPDNTLDPGPHGHQAGLETARMEAATRGDGRGRTDFAVQCDALTAALFARIRPRHRRE